MDVFRNENLLSTLHDMTVKSIFYAVDHTGTHTYMDIYCYYKAAQVTLVDWNFVFVIIRAAAAWYQACQQEICEPVLTLQGMTSREGRFDYLVTILSIPP
jgi:hypothetical protein